MTDTVKHLHFDGRVLWLLAFYAAWRYGGRLERLVGGEFSVIIALAGWALLMWVSLNDGIHHWIWRRVIARDIAEYLKTRRWPAQ